MANLLRWPEALPLGGRESKITAILADAAEGRCVALAGVSNSGKSFTLRALCRAAEARGEQAVFVYVDCNRMVAFSDQGFYELVLRCVKTTLAASPLAPTLERCYEDIVSPGSPFLAHLRFSEAITTVCEGEESPQRLVLVLDEFDEIMRDIDDSVLLNLRALRDTYPARLSYVTACGRRLSAMRHSHGSEEFAELFGQATHFLPPLSAEAAAALVGRWVCEDNLALTPAEMPLLMVETGGHPGLLAAAGYALSTLRLEAQAMRRTLTLARIEDQLDSDIACQEECSKLWQELDDDERHALLQEAPEEGTITVCQSLLERHLLQRAEGRLRPFCRLFAAYAHRQRIMRQAGARGVRVDVDSGSVWVDGRPAPTLTDLEYRLLLVLYGHLDKIVDRYTVVQAVWGDQYIEEVEDARIEKLMSRLRQKIEPNSAEPRYLLTIRGRGYKLASP